MINVMIIDDDPMVAEFNRRYVELVDGFRVVKTVHQATSALQELEQQPIDLILLDVFMPGINGLDFLVQLRQAANDIGVIVISAACDGQSIKKALQFGAADYIIKPFEFERLQTALTTYKQRDNLVADSRLSQDDLDRCLLPQPQTDSLPVPKGIDRNTLLTAWKQIETIQSSSFSTEELAQSIGISRISMRKYLEFLQNINVLKMELVYGTVGRPIYKYRCNGGASQLIRHYL